jgi:trehalose/maltose hydrolase-like predicted phosphorylase
MGARVKLDPKHRPIDPPVARGPRGRDLPAYVSNGLVGLRVRENPLSDGMAIVSGFTGEHHERHVEAAAAVPYPLGGDVAIDGLWASEQPECVEPIDQAYDFSTGELTTRITYAALGVRLTLSVVTFCSRPHPAVVCQEVEIRADRACEVMWRARVDPDAVRGRVLSRRLDTPGEPEPVCDGTMLWGSDGDLASCGLALHTEGPAAATRSQEPWDDCGPLGTTYRLRMAGNRRVLFRQVVAITPSVMHRQPDAQAARLLAGAKALGFVELRRANRAAWAEIWQSRIRLVGAEAKWQAMADAAMFYLNSSTHPASPASTSIFGLATWRDYHYYFGHVMWDVDAFAVPPVTLVQPMAARALLEFRSHNLAAARDNARMVGLPGLKFPWEAAPSTGQEATPGAATGALREDHVSLHIARAFAFHADATGDGRFLREQAWPVISGVADWIVGRVTPGRGGRFDWLHVGGAAERKEASDNDAMTVLLARSVLERAAALAAELGIPAPEAWRKVAGGLSPPIRADGAIAAHEGHHIDEEQGAAPGPLMALFPYWIGLDPETERRTLEFYLAHWRGFVGPPMLPALYPVWACWLGDRDLALTLMQEGYGAYLAGRFAQTLEYRLDKTPDGVAAGPFTANMGGFLTGLLLGLPGVRCGPGPPETWPQRPVVLPRGWQAIECDRLWIQGRPARLRAVHGADRAELSWS